MYCTVQLYSLYTSVYVCLTGRKRGVAYVSVDPVGFSCFSFSGGIRLPLDDLSVLLRVSEYTKNKTDFTILVSRNEAKYRT